MRTQRKKHSRLWVYLLYLGLVTSLILSVTLARYAGSAGGTGTASVAALALEPEPITMSLDGLLPGGEKSLEFQVVNFIKDKAVSEVALDYEITVKTTGNLPLAFDLTAEALTGANAAGTTVDTGPMLQDDGKTQVLENGGRAQTVKNGWFPLVENETTHALEEQAHVYKLTVTWPEEKGDAKYADEIELVTVTVTAAQRLSDPGGSAGS